MRSPFRLPWATTGGRRAASAASVTPVTETKATGGFAIVAGDGAARWSGRSYGALSRTGFMRNPVAHRAVRLVAEAAACVSWLGYDGEAELSEHPALSLLTQPNGRQAGPDFFETLYGHLLLAGNAYVEPLSIGSGLRELHLLRPDRVSVVEGRDGWIAAYDYRAGQMTRRLQAEAGDGSPSLLHLKLFHPFDDHSGFPPLGAAGAALDLTMRPASGTRRCSTIRHGPPARSSTSRRTAATFRPTSTSG